MVPPFRQPTCLIAGILLLSLFLVCPVLGATWTVCPSGCNFTSVQSAINQASDGDTIVVMSGRYNEVIDINRSVMVIGINTTGSIPDIGMYTMPVAATISARNVTLQGVELRGAGKYTVLITADHTTLRDVWINSHRPEKLSDPAIFGNGLVDVSILDSHIRSMGTSGIELMDSAPVKVKNTLVMLGEEQDFNKKAISLLYTRDRAVYGGLELSGNTIVGGPLQVGTAISETNTSRPLVQDVLVDNNTLEATSPGGITLHGFPGMTENETRYDLSGVTVTRNKVNGYFYHSAIEVLGADGTSLSGNTVRDGVMGISGISLDNSKRFTVTDNTVTNCTGESMVGLRLDYVKESAVMRNTLQKNQMNFGYYPGNLTAPLMIIDTTNTADGKPVYYFEGKSGLTITGSQDPACIVLVSCTEVDISGARLTKNREGVGVFQSSRVLLHENSVTDCMHAFLFSRSSEVIVRNNTMTRCYSGTHLLDTPSALFLGNRVSEGKGGVSVAGPARNYIISDNTLTDLNQGVWIYGTKGGENIFCTGNTLTNVGNPFSLISADNITIEANKVTGFTGSGISARISKNGRFIKNTIDSGANTATGPCILLINSGPGDQGMVYRGGNHTIVNNYFNANMHVIISDPMPAQAGTNDIQPSRWNVTKTAGENIVKGPFLGGNYWACPNGSGWSQVVPDRGDGFCTLPYVLDSQNTDYLPLHRINETPADYALQLYAGWNQVGVPKPLAVGKDTASVFSGVDTASHSILVYDPSSGWQQVKPNDTVRQLDAYWIYAVRPTQVNLTFARPSPLTPATKALYAGWNGVGFSAITPVPARDTLLAVKDAWVNTIPFDARNQSFGTTIINGGSGPYSDERTLEPGQGYWVFMNAPGTLPAFST